MQMVFGIFLIVTGIIMLVAVIRRERNARRKHTAIEARKTGQYNLAHEDEIFSELLEQFADMVGEIATLTNRRIRKEFPDFASDSLCFSRVQSSVAMALIIAKLGELKGDAAVGAVAFMLKETAVQVRRLCQAQSFVFPSILYIATICKCEFDVRIGLRVFTFDVRRNAIMLLCELFREIRSELNKARIMMDLDVGPPDA